MFQCQIIRNVLKRFTKRTIYLAGTAASAAACFLSCIAPSSLPLLIAMNAVKGLAMGATSSMLYAMFADAVDWGEYRNGIRAAGLGTGLLQCMGKFGIGLGTALMGAVLAAGGFSAGAAVQTGRGVSALIAVYTWIPGIVLVLSLGIMFAPIWINSIRKWPGRCGNAGSRAFIPSDRSDGQNGNSRIAVQ
jgi:GPH family glycoside/pentoside/hexuronide:cation symporter